MTKLNKILYLILLLVLDVIIVASAYLRITQPEIDIPQLLYCLLYGVDNTDSGPLIDGICTCIPYAILIYIPLFLIFYSDKFFKWEKIGIFKYIIKKRKVFTIILVILSLLICERLLWVDKYIYNYFKTSTFIDKNYVDPSKVDVTFDEKRNLVFIVLESFEGTIIEDGKGGVWEYSLIPEMTNLLSDDDSVAFTSKNGNVGMKMIPGAHYSTASLFANNSGLPFKYYPDKRLTKDDFMQGAYTLGDMLLDNGYHNELITAPTSSFGGLKELFTNHGNYEIIDIDNLKDYGYKIEERNLNPWGFNDEYLFEIAKDRMVKLSASGEPFNLTLVGIDTHFPFGFIYDYSKSTYKTSCENAYATESSLVYEFVSWIKEQDFYENTTIVIIGDHESMAYRLFSGIDEEDRYVYELFINPAVKPINTSGRLYSALDTYPSIIAALGGRIEGNRLGIGTNLFSDQKTILEKYGLDKSLKELDKMSKLYYKEIYRN